MAKVRFRLKGLHRRHEGLTKAVALNYIEAASVCLARHHEAPTKISIEEGNGDQHHAAEVSWDAPDKRTLSAWNNETDATANGAYGCALAAVEAVRNLVAVCRAETRTGADYYVGPPGGGRDDLEDCYRFEISGVDRGQPEVVRRRLRAKVEQTKRGASNLPAFAGVVGFHARLIALSTIEEE